jgi:hypothetical protein
MRAGSAPETVHMHLVKESNMKRLMTCAVLLALTATIAGCSSSGSTSSAGSAASAGAATNAVATASSGATTAGSTTAAATPTPALAVGGGDTCKFLSASDAAALVANAGPAKVAVANSPIAQTTTCTWGAASDNVLYLVANELKSAAPLAAIQAEMVKSITETIPGLGDVGGFETKTATTVSVVFIKGSTQISLSVSSAAVSADAVVAAAKKIAGGI